MEEKGVVFEGNESTASHQGLRQVSFLLSRMQSHYFPKLRGETAVLASHSGRLKSWLGVGNRPGGRAGVT